MTDTNGHATSSGVVERIVDRAFRYGIAGAIGVYLVYVLAGKLDGKVDALVVGLTKHQEASQKIEATLYNIEYWQRRQTEISTAACMNNANSADQRDRCQPPPGGNR